MLREPSLADIPERCGIDVPSRSSSKHRYDNACEERAEGQQPVSNSCEIRVVGQQFGEPCGIYSVRIFEYTEVRSVPLSHIARCPGSADNADYAFVTTVTAAAAPPRRSSARHRRGLDVGRLLHTELLQLADGRTGIAGLSIAITRSRPVRQRLQIPFGF